MMPEHIEVHTTHGDVKQLISDEAALIGGLLFGFVFLIAFAKKFIGAWDWFCTQVNKGQSAEIDEKIGEAKVDLDDHCKNRVTDLTVHLEDMLKPAIKKIDDMSEDVTQLRLDHVNLSGDIKTVTTDLNNLKGYVEAVDERGKKDQERINELEKG
jgi:hypothetical protein